MQLSSLFERRSSRILVESMYPVPLVASLDFFPVRGVPHSTGIMLAGPNVLKTSHTQRLNSVAGRFCFASKNANLGCRPVVLTHDELYLFAVSEGGSIQ